MIYGFFYRGVIVCCKVLIKGIYLFVDFGRVWLLKLGNLGRCIWKGIVCLFCSVFRKGRKWVCLLLLLCNINIFIIWMEEFLKGKIVGGFVFFGVLKFMVYFEVFFILNF